MVAGGYYCYRWWSEKLDAGAAVEEYERLHADIFPNERLALLHERERLKR
ncbi:MAG: hypothetical protein R2911_00270 [Caldilineaceae bacterium]